mgnify:CR=1 FL=1
MEDLVIVGTGPAGLTAATYAARAGLSPLVVAGTLPGGQLTQTTEVENYPGFPDGILGFDLMDAMRKQAERFDARVENADVESASLAPGGPNALHMAGGDSLECRALIIATGARPRELGLPSEQALKNKGVSYCATCDGAFFRDVPIVVVGGGDSAVEEALFLTRFGSKVILVHRRDELRAQTIMQERAFRAEKLEFRWSCLVDDVLGVDDDKVTGVRLRDRKTDKTFEEECGAVFVAIGHIPNTQPFADQLDVDEEGYIQVDGCTSRTGVDGVFAAGDCADRIYRQAVTAAGMGCRAAIDAERWLTEQQG